MATATSRRGGHVPHFDEDPFDEDFRPASEREHRSYVGEMRRGDAEQRAHFERQMRDEGLDPKTGRRAKPGGTGESRHASSTVPAIRRGTSRAYGDARAAGAKTARSTRSVLGGRSPGSASGLVLGLAGYAIVINYIRWGTPGVKGWFSAKFVNKPFTAPGTKSATILPFKAPAAPGAHPAVAAAK
jgi:hypothetical protein